MEVVCAGIAFSMESTDKGTIILPTAYLPNLEYFTCLLWSERAIVDLTEKFQRQTTRNRCTILNANGIQNLSVPVSREYGSETLTRDIRISYAEDWQKNHLRSLESAYRRTPYYEYYIDSLTAIIQSQKEYLFELNFELLIYLADKIGLACELDINTGNEGLAKIHPLVLPEKNSSFQGKEYLQTFTERYGFTANLSVLDLLFNEGPNSICILQESL